MSRPSIRPLSFRPCCIHDTEREVRLAARADTFLLAVEAVTMRPVVGEVSQVVALGRVCQSHGAAPQAATDMLTTLLVGTVSGDPVVHQLDRQFRQVDARPLPL